VLLAVDAVDGHMPQTALRHAKVIQARLRPSSSSTRFDRDGGAPGMGLGQTSICSTGWSAKDEQLDFPVI